MAPNGAIFEGYFFGGTPDERGDEGSIRLCVIPTRFKRESTLPTKGVTRFDGCGLILGVLFVEAGPA